MTLKEMTAVFGLILSGIAALFGGWSEILNLLFWAMAIDFVTGLICAGVFGRSTKTQHGSLDSKAGFRGLGKKAVILLVVLLAHQVDRVIGTAYVMDAACFMYSANEVVSITENLALMGVPLPQALIDKIEALKGDDEIKENEK